MAITDKAGVVAVRSHIRIRTAHAALSPSTLYVAGWREIGLRLGCQYVGLSRLLRVETVILFLEGCLSVET